MFDSARKVGHRLHKLAQTFFDALGDDDLTFAREKFYRAHFAHVHADRVGGAAGLVLNGGKGGCGFGSCYVVGT